MTERQIDSQSSINHANNVQILVFGGELRNLVNKPSRISSWSTPTLMAEPSC
jgi:hypothetical protein